MQHRTIRGRLDYVTDNVGVMGREWFTHTIHTDGRRTMRALTEMDDDEVLRDVTFSVDRDWKPLDCFVRLTIHDRFQGSAWFRFTDAYTECESFTVDAGRISQRWPMGARAPMFVSHAVSCDAWTNALFDKSRCAQVQRIAPRLASSPLGNGGSGPMIGDRTTVTPQGSWLDLAYVAEEEVTVPAGTFTCNRIILNKGLIPRFEIWTHGPDYLPVQLRYDRLKQYYVLAELQVSD
ncbi:MAG: hypothetical protein EXQ85_03995 [Alphaproteobacteria bacterium]|nr:hypothetical protein [Alphaproteobacteria bacterium]